MDNAVPDKITYQLKSDFLASIVVFLVAVPLCLGIALASGAPLFSGIVSGVIGGIIVGIISESPYSVSGPAAGMLAVIITTISQLGSFEAFLLALMIAGILQIIWGVLRVGFIANFAPSTVIHGLLAAIGILIIIKQLPLAFGYYNEAGSMKEALKIAEQTLDFTPVWQLLTSYHAGATIITSVSMLLLVIWEKYFKNAGKILPGAVLVVVVAVLTNEFFQYFMPKLALPSSHLVNIPVNETFSDFISQFRHPDFSKFLEFKVYVYALMMAVVASLETLLNLEAVEKLDRKHRYSSRNRELIAQGIGNTLAGLLGGLPITSVIVRSSVNINAGARSKLSTIFHGIFLVLSITLVSEWLNLIPVAALASILIFTGYKLAKPSVFKSAYNEGRRYFIPFIITVITIVATNLLLGIIIGLLVSIFFILHHNSQNCFVQVDEKYASGNTMRLILPQQVSFLNKAAIVEELNRIPNHAKIVIDASNTDYIDHDILGVIQEFREYQAADKKILLNLEGFQQRYNIGNQTKFINVTTYDVQATLTPDMVLRILNEGNYRFMNNQPIHKNYKQQISATSQSQHPIAVVFSCIDSRVPVELIFDLSLGDVFVVRVAGNVANDEVLGSIEFACLVAEAKLIVVLGHKGCGAIKAACDDFQLGYITQLMDRIKPAIEQEKQTTVNRTGTNDEFVLNVIRNHISLTKQYLYHRSHILRELIDTKQAGIVGALYDVNTGQVEFEEMQSAHKSESRLLS